MAEVDAQGARLLEGLDPLRTVDPNHEMAGLLWRFLNFPNGGDVILFGRYDGERVVSFDDQVGAHGALGGPQGRPFLLLPATHPMAGELLHGYGAIYREVLTRYRQWNGLTGTGCPTRRPSPSAAPTSASRPRG